MGLDVRVKQLLGAASPTRQSEITKATDRLIDVTGMGQQYKFMGVLPRGSAADAFPFNLP
jgi:NADH dehydrogenase [ubiquinone] 1 alpha subcomplex assembly factor 7